MFFVKDVAADFAASSRRSGVAGMETKLDNYTKIVLTVIAISLSVISLQNMGVVQAVAQQRPTIQKVLICSPARNDYCAEVSSGYLQVTNTPN
jgi:hypothetical protein